jgi:hypothetical protein
LREKPAVPVVTADAGFTAEWILGRQRLRWPRLDDARRAVVQPLVEGDELAGTPEVPVLRAPRRQESIKDTRGDAVQAVHSIVRVIVGDPPVHAPIAIVPADRAGTLIERLNPLAYDLASPVRIADSVAVLVIGEKVALS